MREIWVCSGIGANYLREELNFPGVKQVARIRKTISEKGEIVMTEDWYGITSCGREERPSKELLQTAQGALERGKQLAPC